MNSKVSIILPTYNGEKYIRRAIESILSQSFSDWELIIINDCSSDNTEIILKEYIAKDVRIFYIKNEINLGVHKSLNKGLKEAKGDYIARIDDDDEWIDKDKLKKQIEFLENNKDYVLVGTGVVLVDIYGNEINRYLMPILDKDIRKKLLRINCFIHSSVVFRKSILDMSGNYDGLLEDYDLWLRMGVLGKMANLASYSVKYWLNNTGVNSQKKVLRLKENLFLSKKYKNKYSGYWKALTLGYLKLFFYPLVKILPTKLIGHLHKWHKDF
jgi:glycosyltransferase involved in cell wall biosynthesis